MLLLETIRIQGGKALYLPYHNQRFNTTRKALFEIDEPLDLSNYIIPPDEELYRCRILYDREIQKIEYLPYQPTVIEKISLVESDIDYPFKYADRAAFDMLLAAAPQSDDVLIIHKGFLTDTTIANIAFLEKEKWITPAKPLLEGTTRMRLIDEGFLTPKAIQKDAISHFDGFALMNAMIGFRIINPIWLGSVKKHQK